ncbi:MAG TPA: alpha/beta hydrolase [Mycobacteriales bacterium]|nr:alpha/beta hydrolase [Mycobacteriales bacterium]
MHVVAAPVDVGVQYRRIHGYRRAFRIAGSGPPLLLLHGIGDTSATWDRVISLLASKYTVIAPDLLGHGQSDKPRADYAISAYACGMRDLLAVLDIDSATIVGHSLGGGVAMQFAYQFPERCERLVVVSTGGVGREVHPILRVAAGPLAEVTLPFATAGPVRWAVRTTTPLLRKVPVVSLGDDTPYIVERYDALSSARSRSAFLRTLRAGVDIRGQVVTMLDRCYLAAGLPTMIMWGAHDPVIPVRHATIAHEAMPGSRLEIFADCGHFPHRDDPARFAKTLHEFMSSTAPATYDVDAWRELLREGGGDSPEPEVAASLDVAESSGS